MCVSSSCPGSFGFTKIAIHTVALSWTVQSEVEKTSFWIAVMRNIMIYVLLQHSLLLFTIALVSEHRYMRWPQIRTDLMHAIFLLAAPIDQALQSNAGDQQIESD